MSGDAFIIENFNLSEINFSFILRNSPDIVSTNQRGFFDIYPLSIDIDHGTFSNTAIKFPDVEIIQTSTNIAISCACESSKKKLCEHQIQLLYNIMERQELRTYFDKPLRHSKIKEIAKDYGLEKEDNLDELFQIDFHNKYIEIKPKVKELLPINEETEALLKEELLPKETIVIPEEPTTTGMIMVLARHKYYSHFIIELFEAQRTKDGQVKNPLTSLDPSSFIWKTENIEELKFYTGVSKFQNNYTVDKSEVDIEGLKALVRNPLGLDVFFHDADASEKFTASSLIPVKLKTLQTDINLTVDLKDNFHEISGELIVDDTTYPITELKVRFDYFILIEETLYLIDDSDVRRVVEFFKKHNHKILIHHSKFEEFRMNILSKLENKIHITYSYIREATKIQIEESGFDLPNEKMIYLSDSKNYVLITPVMKYGNIEVPILTKKQIYANDANGNPFTLKRDDDAEISFMALLTRQHPDFVEQLIAESFYLHKEEFLDEEWFLETMDTWKKHNIKILGFNEIKDHNLNPNKATLSISVSSGIDWFNTYINVSFGEKKVPLKQLYKSVRNQNKFVQLDDGTLGILPTAWLQKFAQYFNSGEIVEEEIRTPKTNFLTVAELYEDAMLNQDVKDEITLYKKSFTEFTSIKKTEVPASLKTTLKDYQKEGLNWLNFLDEFGFGGCLADDMGLGKTVQVIAFILSQREKQKHNTNLIVVPTSLIFNWQKEVEKFGPDIKIKTIYGVDRIKNTEGFNEYEIILTTYGLLLSDIRFLKDYKFNYTFLDESQLIKNPESQRYKAARMLQSRNKIVMTGTPIENNTFDLFGQMSFACPGLLGTKYQFKHRYSTPIDKFEDRKRADELQKKIKPFILRRTKKQVAKELPEKTEMVIYCEMGDEQRKIYDAYEKELREYILTKNNDDLPKETMHVLRGLTKMRQICNSPALLNEDKYYGNASSKIEVLLEQIDSKSDQHKILVFSQFVVMLDLIKAELEKRKINFEYLTGQTKNRESKVERFQNDENCRVFLISLKAGGTGLNLTRADYVYLVDPWWNPAVENQAIDRSYRIGQKNNVVAVRLICPGTIEEKIMKLQESKKELVNDLIKTDVSVLKQLSKKDLLDLFN